MREAELLYVIVALIYLYESVLVLPAGALALQRPWRRWQRRTPLVLRSGRGPAVTLGALFPPLGPTLPVTRGGSLSTKGAREAVMATTHATLPLRIAENLLFVGVFGGGALLVWFDGAPDMAIIACVVGLWLLCLGTAIDARRRSARERRPAWKDIIIVGGSPVSAIRLHDLFFKVACPSVDETAAVVALAPPPVAREALRRAIAGARYADDGPLAALESFAVENGFDPVELDAEPSRDHPEDVAFCPICHASFSRLDTNCSTCAQVPVRPFARIS